MLRAVLVDDSPDLRALTRLCLELDCDAEVVGEAEDGAAALSQISLLDPDVAIIDIHLPGLSGLDVIRHLRATGCSVRLVAYSSDDDALREALTAGADAAVLKGDTSNDLIAAVCPAA